ncbi:hypothetical protein [Oceanospirillum sediminis]|uniref:Uncharacterized protein n=1 Tax=Oceanospirillum sediminis TaxID=2760088 RepID=A0A839IR50_9GAMM|nr:hypothetical protein [Oceanospirillum sediminis]MBB1487180.1 hypothetical protein [Oceanospirillum sediminis]
MSLSDHLSEYSITISEARDFIVSNIGNPGEILSFGRSHNLTAQMLADIYGDLNAEQVHSYFDDAGLDYDSVYNTANKLILSETHSEIIASTNDKSDMYSIELQADQAYMITLESDDIEALNLIISHKWGMYPIEHEVINDGAIQIEFTPNVTSTYHLNVSSENYIIDNGWVVNTGDYSLNISESTVEDNTGNRAETAISMQVGESLEGVIETGGDQDWIAVDLQLGSVYAISLSGDLTELKSAMTVNGEWRDSISMTLYGGTSDVQSAKQEDGDHLLVYTPQQTGTHYIAIDPQANSDTGSYLVGVADITPDTL